MSEQSWVSNRAIVLLAVVALHLVFIWALATGLVGRAVESIATPLMADILTETLPKEVPPPPPPPKFDSPPVDLPPPVIDIVVPTEIKKDDVAIGPRVIGAPPVIRTAIRQNPKFPQPKAQDFYPPESKEAGEQGTVRVRICVDVEGRFGSASVDQSSGAPRLDEAALKMAKQYQLLPPTENGKPVAGCNTVPIRFRLPAK